MMNREHLERLLKLNGLESTAKDEEIKSVLLSARYANDEIDTAIMILRENKISHKKHVDGLHKVFRTDQSLTSSEISSLLGIDVDIEHPLPAGIKAKKLTIFNQIILIIVSIFLAVVGVLMYMYVFEIGLFHATSAFAAPVFK